MHTPTTLRRLAGLTPVTAIDRAKTALVLIDFQMEYFSPGPLLLPGGEEAAASAARLACAADNAGLAVFHVRHLAASPSAPAFAPGSQGAAFHPALTPKPRHTVVSKGLPSSFLGTGLGEMLKERGLDTLILAGLMTHMCLDTTARDAAQSGYTVLVAADAAATRDLPRFGGGVVPWRELHEAVLAGLGDRFAEIMDTETIISLL